MMKSITILLILLILAAVTIGFSADSRSDAPFFPPAPAETFLAKNKRLSRSAAREFVMPFQLASGDFSVKAELLAPALRTAAFQVEIGADAFVFDGEKALLTNAGNAGIRTFANHPLRVPLGGIVTGGKPFRLDITMKRGVLTVSLEGREVWRDDFGRDTYGEVAVTALSGEVDMRRLEVRGALARQTSVPVFTSGKEGAAFYRIPAIVRARDGTLLVFAEARRSDFHDLGDIDMVLRRSTDEGRAWLPIQTLHDGGGSSAVSCGNPAPLVEPDTGRIHLLFLMVEKSKWGSGDYKVPHLFSDDSGATWSEPEDIRPQLPADWRTFHPGPGHGIVKHRAPHPGRLIVSGWHVWHDAQANKRRYSSSLIYSDDRGKTWHAGGTGMKFSDESMVAELADGSLMMAIRPPPDTPDSGFRHFATSHDGGTTFAPFFVDRALRATVCQSSLLTADGGSPLFFIYPGSGNYAPGAITRRAGLTLRWKKHADGAWSPPQLIYAGRSAYSDMTLLPGGKPGVVFEGGRQSDIGGIRFALVTPAPFVDWRADGAWGRDANARMIKVTGLDPDSAGNLYVAGGERGGGGAVVVLDRDGRETARWGEFINDKHGLRIFDDKVWLTDIGNHAVYQCTPGGKILRTFGVVGEAGEDADRFNKPTDVALAPDGSIYITDGYGNSRVVCLAPDGAFRFAWGKRGAGPGEFHNPHNIVIRDNRVYVADRDNARIQVFTLTGDFVAEWKNVGRPYGLFLAKDGQLYVSMVDDKAGVEAVLVMTPDGEIRQTIGRRGRAPGEFDVPHSLAVLPDGQAIYVGEVGNKRVQRITRD